MATKSTKYFILDENQKPKEVSQEEHLIWKEKNSAKYNRYKKFDGNSKEAHLTFVGIEEPDEEKIIFEVRTIFRSFDGEIVDTPFDEENFTSYDEAVESYELYLIMNGGDEE